MRLQNSEQEYIERSYSSTAHRRVRLRCEICAKEFKVKGDLTRHMRQDHFTERCFICGAVFENHNEVLGHMKRKHDDHPYRCAKCNRYLESLESLEKHKQWHSDMIKRSSVACRECGKVIRDYNYSTHMRLHSKEKPNTCPVCGKTFRWLSPLERHIVAHSGEKPYVCDICGRDFSQRPSLVAHRKQHPGPLPPLKTVSLKNIVKEYLETYKRAKRKTN
nr:LOW QUALITY PROTEIN: zinc finger protein 678-like [Megalopta genalis]